MWEQVKSEYILNQIFIYIKVKQLYFPSELSGRLLQMLPPFLAYRLKYRAQMIDDYQDSGHDKRTLHNKMGSVRSWGIGKIGV